MRDLSRTMKVVLGGAAAIGVALGAGGIASAVGGPNPSSVAADNTQEPAYTSSVTTADTETENEDEADESAALAGSAKITADEARDAALAAVPGTVGEVELENENGNVVYGVEITNSSGATYDVKVDAGNGTVLAQEADDADEGDEGDDETNEGAEGDDDDANEGPESNDDANEGQESNDDANEGPEVDAGK